MKKEYILTLFFLMSLTACIFDNDSIEPERFDPPQRVHLRSVSISGISNTDADGNSWDNGSFPDLQFQLFEYVATGPNSSKRSDIWNSEIISNANPQQVHTIYPPDSILTFEQPEKWKDWQIWDVDTFLIGGNQLMAQYAFQFASSFDGPQTDTITKRGQQGVKIQFAVDYEY